MNLYMINICSFYVNFFGFEEFDCVWGDEFFFIGNWFFYVVGINMDS